VLELGAVEVYARLCEAELPGLSRKALRAIEGAVLDCDWRGLPAEPKRDLERELAARLAT
jgi:hypothetical protein